MHRVGRLALAVALVVAAVFTSSVRAATVVAGSDGWLSAGPGGCLSVGRDGSTRASSPPLPQIAPSSDTEPAVAFDGTNLVAIWAEGGSIYAARWSQACVLLDPGVVTVWTPPEFCTEIGFPEGMPPEYCSGLGYGIQPGLEHLALGFDGANYLATWMRNVGVPYVYMAPQTTYYGLYTARFTPGLELLPPGVQGQTGTYDGRYTGEFGMALEMAASPAGLFVVRELDPGKLRWGFVYEEGGLYPLDSVDYQAGFTASGVCGFNYETNDWGYPGGQDVSAFLPSVATSGDGFLATATVLALDTSDNPSSPFQTLHVYWRCPGAGSTQVLPATTGWGGLGDPPANRTQVFYDGWHYVAWWDGSYERVDTLGSPIDATPRPLSGEVLAAGTDGTHLVLTPNETYAFLTTWFRVTASTFGYGAGTVESDPPGISCGGACEARFDADAQVTLHARPAAGSRFVGWTGVCAGSGPDCAVTPEITKRSTVVSALFADAVPPVVTVPANAALVATTARGTPFTFAATASDNLHGALTPICAPASGAVFAPGTTTVTCTADDGDGNVGRASFTVSVTFAWSGFLSPVREGATFWRVRPIPVSFRLTGASAGIAQLPARLFVAPVRGGVVGAERPAPSLLGGNGFRYDPLLRTYGLSIPPGGLGAGTWRLRADLGDGVSRTVQIHVL